ncbi:MAG: hypothetical protein COA52_02430 [Hyphomicrobiales bacterium]|nr:MAG: hypothetical protein COA52_02430 [Hyphomicrobiales bacterium]
MTDQPDGAVLLAEIMEGLEGVTPSPWAYMPNEFDDWGTVRAKISNAGQSYGAAVSFTRTHNAVDYAKHWKDGTDPYSDNGKHLARCSPDNIRAISAAMKAKDSEIERLKATVKQADLEHNETVKLLRELIKDRDEIIDALVTLKGGEADG